LKYLKKKKKKREFFSLFGFQSAAQPLPRGSLAFRAERPISRLSARASHPAWAEPILARGLARACTAGLSHAVTDESARPLFC
jgi:hypothetical protein